MMLLLVGANYRTAPVELRECAIGPDQLPRALEGLTTRFGCESVVLSTCNRIECYVARLETDAPLTHELLADYLAEFHRVPCDRIRPLLYHAIGPNAVHHLFRVVGSLDSMVLGEGQIAGQVKQAYDRISKPAPWARFSMPCSSMPAWSPSAFVRKRTSVMARCRCRAWQSII